MIFSPDVLLEYDTVFPFKSNTSSTLLPKAISNVAFKFISSVKVTVFPETVTFPPKADEKPDIEVTFPPLPVVAAPLSNTPPRIIVISRRERKARCGEKDAVPSRWHKRAKPMAKRFPIVGTRVPFRWHKDTSLRATSCPAADILVCVACWASFPPASRLTTSMIIRFISFRFIVISIPFKHCFKKPASFRIHPAIPLPTGHCGHDPQSHTILCIWQDEMPGQARQDTEMSPSFVSSSDARAVRPYDWPPSETLRATSLLVD